MNSSTLVRNGLCMAIAALAAHPLHAATVTVSTAADLLTAIQNAASGDTIQLSPGEYDITGVADNTTFHLYSGDKTLTLEGTDATSWRDRPSRETAAVLKGGSSSRLMLGYSGSLTLKHITFKGASHTGYGAVLQRNVRGVAVVTNCVFASNTCTLLGAAAYCPDGIFQDCLFRDNSSTAGGGAAYFGEFHSCVFDSNRSTLGGAAFDIDAYGCLFTNNTASISTGGKGQGGAVGYTAAGSSRTLVGCTFADNGATTECGLGGAIYQEAGTLAVSNCVFRSCRATSSWTSAGLRGGGSICENGGTITIDCSSFENCNGAAYGGAIYGKSGMMTIASCDFSGNVSRDGGALFFESSGAGNVRGSLVTNCTFSANKANSAGGAVFGCTNVVACSFVSNTNTYFGAHCFGSIVRDSRFTGDGGVGNSMLVRCILDGVHTTGADNYNRAAVIAVNSTPPDFPVQAVNCLFVNCDSFYLLESWGLPLGIVNCTFANNSMASYFAFGNTYVSGDSAAWSFANCIFAGNSRGGTGIGLEINVANGVPLDLGIQNCLADSGYDIPTASASPTRTVSTSEANTGLAKFVGPGHYSGAPAYTPNLSCSQVVNRGLALDWTASDIDLAGNARIHDGAVDLGCYESCYAEHATVLSIR